jgi:predicted RND superfamily exporter protein
MTRFIIRYPRAIIAAVIFVTLLLGVGLLRMGLELDVSPDGFIEAGSREQNDFLNARKTFGPDDYLVIAVTSDDVFSPASLNRLQSLHTRLEKTSGVSEILSLINVPCARSNSEGASLDRLLPASFADAARLAEARQTALTDRLYVGNLVSPDAKTAAINILFRAELPTNARHTIMRQIYDAVRSAGFAEAYFAGDPFSQWLATEAVKRDLRVFLPLTIVLIGLLMWGCFRSVNAVLLPMLTIGIGLVWLFGLMAVMKAHFTILALMLPTLMLAIGCSYIIHVINQIGIVNALHGKNHEKTWILQIAIDFISLPVIVSALTIIAGFLSLAFTKIPAIRTTAVYSAMGAAITCALSLTFIPAVLLVHSQHACAFRAGLSGKMVKLLEGLGRWATSHQTLLYVLTAVIVMGSVLGLRRIVIDIDYFHFLKRNTETGIGLAEISRRLSGAVNFELILEGKNAGAAESPVVLENISRLQAWAEHEGNGKEPSASSTAPGIDRTLSVADFVKHINRAFHNNDAAEYAIPKDEKVIQELLSDRTSLRPFLSEDGRSTRILVRSNLTRSAAMGSVARRLEEQGKALFPDFRVYTTGTFILLNRTSDQIAGEQVLSISLALVTIFLMLAMLFRSARVGFTALVPNLIPILFFFGFMGWQGIPLNLTTSLVASVVLGLAVDNAVQFIVRFRRVQATNETLRDAIVESMRLSGRPIIYANIALASTFAIFSLSNFEPIGSFGLLSAVTILGCLVEDLVLLPARLTSPVFKAK